MTNLFSQSAIYSPTVTKYTIVECSVSDAALLRELRQSLGFAIKRKPNGISSVSGLLYRSCPAAIPWFVVAIGVWVTINTVFQRGSWPHVLKERPERNFPFLANGHTHCSVVFVGRIAWIEASSEHRIPRSKFGRGGLSMCSDAVANLPGEASAAFGSLDFSQVIGGNRTLVFAITATNPICVARFAFSFWIVGDHNQPTKPLARQIFHAGWDRDKLGISHDCSPETVCGEKRQRSTIPVAFRHLYTGSLAA